MKKIIILVLFYVLIGFSNAFLFFTCVCSAAIIHVPQDQPTIQEGINAASNNDIVLVANGTYTGANNRNLQWNATIKHLVVMSSGGAVNCIIDCQSLGQGFILNSGQDTTDVIDGFTIVNGFAPSIGGTFPDNCIGGGGIQCFNTSPKIINCRIINNNTEGPVGINFVDGGGIECAHGAPVIRNNHISNNTATHTGGGIHIIDAHPIIENNLITGNTADGCYGGGGISFTYNSSGRVVGNLITNNTALYYSRGGYGGGIICMNSNPLIANNTIVNNTTKNGTDLGQGGGIRVGGLPVPQIVNCILWNNEAEEGHEELSRSALFELDITYSDIKGGLDSIVLDWFITNINSNPLFIGGIPFDYALSSGSPCIDMGCPSTSGLYLPNLDLAGNPRLIGDYIDIGAYEFQTDMGAYLINNSKKLLIYPNPANNNIIIEGLQAGQIEIIDLNGKVIKNENISYTKTSIDISKLSSGVYSIRIKTDDGIIIKKLVKE